MSNVKAMILSVGGSAEPLIKSIEHHSPEFVCFFASQATNDQTVTVKEALKDFFPSIGYETELVDNGDDLLECYERAEKAVERVIKRGFAKEHVVIDYTGATKNISVALALAAIEKGFSFSYVGGNKRTKGGVGIVETGHEQIYSNVNPWDFMAVKERRLAAMLFNTFQYKPCKEVLTELAGNASLRRSVYRKLAFVVEAFYCWDLFRHVDAAEQFRKARLDELADDNDRKIAAFATRCAGLTPVLEAIISCSDRGTRPCPDLALDLYANAERRFQEGKIDDAILRLYRLVEMLAQERLLSMQDPIDTSNVRPDQIPLGLRDEFLQRFRNKRTGRIEIPQTQAYILLKELDNPLGHSFAKHGSSFQKVQSARNSSYLAHGFQSSKESTYKTLRDFIAELGALDMSKAPVFPPMTL